MTKTTNRNLYTVIALAIAVFALLAYSFTGAQWTDAPANPPSNNTPAPVNVGPDAQVKAGGLGANVLMASSSVWSPEYCDENGENCKTSAGVPLAGEVGSLAWVVVGPTAELPEWSGSGNSLGSPLSAFTYGSLVEGIHLCPAGQYLGDGNSNNLSVQIEGAGGRCSVTLSGTYQILSHIRNTSTDFQSGGGAGRNHAMALVQKISNLCGVDTDEVCATNSLNTYQAIVDLVYRNTGKKFDRIYNGASERAAVCNMLSSGSSVRSYTNDSYGQPSNNNVGRLVNGNWDWINAQHYNDWLSSIVCD